VAAAGRTYLEAVELGLREAIFRDLCQVLAELLNDPTLRWPGLPADQAKNATPSGPRRLLTLFGARAPVGHLLSCAAEQAGRVPLDRALGLWEGYSPGCCAWSAAPPPRFSL